MDVILEKLEYYWISILDRPDDLLVEEILKFYRYAIDETNLKDIDLNTDNEPYIDERLVYLVYPENEKIFEYIIGVKLDRVENSLSGDSEYNPGVTLNYQTRLDIIRIIFDPDYSSEIYDQCKLTKVADF